MPVQVVSREAVIVLDRIDWSHVTPEALPNRLADTVAADRSRGFDPGVAPLMRVTLARLGPEAYQLIWSVHHAVVDGWCVPILMGELIALYEGLLAGAEVELTSPPTFRDYIAWLRARSLEDTEAYWRRTLTGFREATPLGIGRPENAPGVHAHREVRLSAEMSARLSGIARSGRVTLATILGGAWAILLSRYAGRPDVVFGLTVSGRPPELEGVESMVGLFINTLPLRVEVDEQSGLLPWLGEVQRRQVELRRHEHGSPVAVQGWSEVPRGRPLFESIVVVENYPVDAALAGLAGRLGVEEVRFFDQTNYPLDLTVAVRDRLTLNVGYDSGRFDDAEVERLLTHMITLLEGFAGRPGGRLSEFEHMPASERATLVELGGRPPGPLPEDMPGAATPDAVADEDLDYWIEHLQSFPEGNPR